MIPDAVPFLNLSPSTAPILEALDDVWHSTTRQSQFVGGPLVEKFEAEWAQFCGSTHAVGVANGTDALEIALAGLGIGAGDEVLIPANTFIATAEAVVAVGATPVFVDVEPDTMLVSSRTAAAAVGPRTSALIVVHLYGQAADMTDLMAFAATHQLAVLEDCAQAHGATWRSRPVGTFGAAGCFSFYPGKNLGAFGDGGAIVTNDGALSRTIRRASDHGRSDVNKYKHDVVGRNSRLDAMQAGVLSAKLPHLLSWNADRRRAHDDYAQRLANLPGVQLTTHHPESESSCHLEVIRLHDRDLAQKELANEGIETKIHYPIPCPAQPAYQDFPSADTPVSSESAGRLLSLPMFPGITQAQVQRVCDHLIARADDQ